MSLEVIQLPAFEDNYLYLLHCRQENVWAAVDPGDGQLIDDYLRNGPKRLDLILNTHHHLDHVGGNLLLQKKWGACIYAHHLDRDRIPGFERGLSDGDTIRVGQHQAEVLHVPGHTLNHIAYYFAAQNLLFCGDTMFSIGCGRLFEGTAAQMWDSLRRLRRLPDETKVFCAHEYTWANIDFALSIHSEDPDLLAYRQEVQEKLARNMATIPTTIGLEKKLNLFLRADDRQLLEALRLDPNIPAVKAFSQLRSAKDQF